MVLPKTKTLVSHENTGDGQSCIGPALERSLGVRSEHSGSEAQSLTNVKVFNDYVAVMLIPIESVIAMPGANQFSPVGIIVGIGEKCTNKFEFGERVVVNPKDQGIVAVIEQGPGYEGREVRLYLERNIFYTAQTGPILEVKKSPMPKPITA